MVPRGGEMVGNRRPMGSERAAWPVIAACIAAGIVALAWMAVDLSLSMQLGSGLLLAAAGVWSVRTRKGNRFLLALMSLAVSTRYIVWRATESLGGDNTIDLLASTLLFLAEAYAWTNLVLGTFQTSAFRRRQPISLERWPREQWPQVDVFIPTYNESVDVVRATAIGAAAMDYPNKVVWILDDGRRDTMRLLAAELGCGYLIRPDNKGAKAGNLNAALRQTQGNLIAIFDADHVPTRGFLRATVGFFLDDAKLALVQTPHHFINPDPFERNLFLGTAVPPEQHFFYHTIQVGNDFWNSAFFCGSCAVIRRAPLVAMGGVPTETVTEDAACSLELHARGWRSAYLDLPLAAGLATESFGAHVIQRMRWARGMAQIFRLHNPLLKPGLTVPQRLNYAAASWHFLGALPRLIFVLAAPSYLLLDVHPVDADVRALLVFAVPHLILIWASAAMAHRNTRHSFWSEVYESSIAPYTAFVTVLALVSPRHGVFRVTAKGETNHTLRYDLRMALPLLALLGLTIAALAWTPVKWLAHPDDSLTIGVAALWCVYNLVLLGAAAATALERPQRRESHRVRRPGEVHVTSAGAPQRGRLIDLSLTGAAVRLAGPIPASGRISVDLCDAAPATSLEAEIVRTHIVDGQTIAGLRWLDTTPETQRAIVEAIYGDPDAWLNDRYEHDRPTTSALRVATAPIAALLQGPAWLSRFLGPAARSDGLVPEAHGRPCPGCGHVAPHSLGSCERCGTSVRERPDDMLRNIPSGPWGRFALPTMLAFVGLLATFDMVPTAYATRPQIAPDLPTRIAELRQAEAELTEFAQDVPDASPEQAERALDRLADLRRRHGLDGSRSRWQSASNVEAILQAASLGIHSALSARREGAGVDQRMSSVEETLDEARARLEGA